MIASRYGDVGMRDVLEAVGLVFILRELNFLLIFNDPQWFFSKGLETYAASHESVCQVAQFLLIDHLIIALVVDHSLDA